MKIIESSFLLGSPMLMDSEFVPSVFLQSRTLDRPKLGMQYSLPSGNVQWGIRSLGHSLSQFEVPNEMPMFATWFEKMREQIVVILGIAVNAPSLQVGMLCDKLLQLLLVLKINTQGVSGSSR